MKQISFNFLALTTAGCLFFLHVCLLCVQHKQPRHSLQIHLYFPSSILRLETAKTPIYSMMQLLAWAQAGTSAESHFLLRLTAREPMSRSDCLPLEFSIEQINEEAYITKVQLLLIQTIINAFKEKVSQIDVLKEQFEFLMQMQNARDDAFIWARKRTGTPVI
ncbi:unnamed protein product [Trifolium pratense]|uniref:Uncharacterized protein n=1 Tax=Trifolium pratense TaxID=57577 RepID=A0ACB0LV15_TRIPR|nr:unnamed protein product [Trifolium pratense]